MPTYIKLLMHVVMFSAYLGASGAIISCFWGSVILRHLYGPEYALHNSVLVWTMLAGALTYCTSAIGFGVTAMGCFKEQPWIVGSAAGVLLLSSYRFVPMY